MKKSHPRQSLPGSIATRLEAFRQNTTQVVIVAMLGAGVLDVAKKVSVEAGVYARTALIVYLAWILYPSLRDWMIDEYRHGRWPRKRR